ncbi:hydantoinase B/oxoprolinase family protein [Candidatus Bathyarchaeota archaeon]|jgi:N-methylhydantoinase B|nr:hydantoinase B/oxoprolinase family protein [Candidatus Bathyarchaeota archaeon]MBT4320588.1 hydantoinase B/oxoprolinase family protein [Candidatus Bathyarchaeota archaeon]MBT4423538.1 hydantoinase B/oxoprolinase family protein [Candidatus Bathyarchaeota archaeon]MBT7188461.1 hydantoinase B/oxoprolinase family protein [Candidatus Bathyarchaeota archaeon]MBT7347138.1 hydantoinase B/oxoprolinase family protein [Candidatus Bathyarchaeota archaeon]
MIDYTTVEVIKGALIYAAEEMGISLKKSAYSPNIKERMDHSCALFSHNRELIAQAEHIPVHLGSLALAIKLGLEEYEGELNQGDMLLLNDPYISGTHLPDLTLIAPVFHDGKIIGYAANKAHHTDIGGKTPGSLAPDSTELYQEGLVIPPVKFVRGGVVDKELSKLIRSNVRTPDVQMGDLRAQIAANYTGIRRVLELVDQYGVETLHSAMSQIMDYSERRMRQEISAMPDGVYEGFDYLEDIPRMGMDVEIKVSVTKKGDSLTFDYVGTSPQVESPVNAPLGVTVAGIYYTLISTTDPTIPVNDGCFRPITLNVPLGCMMNPNRPAPVAGGNVETSQRNVDVIMRALSKMIPDKVPAASQGTMNNITIGGILDNGEPWTFYETIGGGNGGRPVSDGVDGIHINMTNTMNTPIETLEAYLPFRFKAYRLRPDSGGPGEFRGGCGIERVWTLTSEKATLSIMAERNKIKPWGLKGGHGGTLGEFILVKKDGTETKLPSKVTVELYRDDTLIIRTPGGGGYGDPRDRAPEKVREDVMNGLVSLESARDIYGLKD